MNVRIMLPIAALTAIAACSSMRDRESNEVRLQRYMDYASDPVQSFSYLGRFDGWQALGRDKLVVWTSINNAYLLTVDEPCRDLQFANAISLTSTTGSVHRGLDSVLVGRDDRCRISEIRPVNYKELKAAQRAGG